jgi:hypothetical protein
MASGERIFQALDWDERLHEPTDPVQLPERLQGEVEKAAQVPRDSSPASTSAPP